MADIALTLLLPHPREVVWRRLWDPERHTAAIPLTRVSCTNPSMAQQGSRIVARTALGPWGVDDVMDVAEVHTPPDGPWQCRVTKQGAVVRGAIVASVTAVVGPDGRPATRVRWRQRISVRGLPACLDPVVGAVAWLSYRAGLARICSA